jgi:RNA polymerase sigma-70 factor (ECF subfamily)
VTRADELAEAFTALRSRLTGIAYAIVGTTAEAWCVVAVSRRALDVLRSARVQRQSYVGPWLPEPVLTPAGNQGHPVGDPVDRVTLADSVSYALMVVLETLSPAERVVWVLHEVFGTPFPEVAAIVGRTPAAVRQLAVRARAHVAAGAPRMQVAAREHTRTVDAFLAATAGGDFGTLLALLDPDVVLTSDGGGQVTAALRPVRGADRVARFLLGVVRKVRPGDEARPVTVNGGPGLAFCREGRLHLVAALTVADGLVRRVDLVLAPAKLRQRPPEPA